MKITLIAILITCLTIYGCKSQENMIFSSQDVVKEKQESNSKNIKIEKVLGNTKWQHISNTQSINIYQIDSVLVDSVEKEYGRKLVKINTVKVKSVDLFIEKVKFEQNYPVLDTLSQKFSPLILFEFCAENCDLSLLFDSTNTKLGFIDNNGQKIVSISKELTDFLTNEIKNN